MPVLAGFDLAVMKKIGIVAQYLTSRNDIREVIERLARQNEVFLFLRKNDNNIFIPGATNRVITDRRKTITNEILTRLFYLFGKLPRSRNNYYITESFKIANTRTSAIFKAEKKLLLFLSRFLPKIISYDRYLNWLDCSDTTPVNDIDVFLCFTEIYDDFLFSHLLRKQKKVFVYVYSWDHPCKMTKFSHRVYKYLVWNEGLKQDMIELQAMQAQQVEVLGASQLAYIAEFKEVEHEYDKPFAFDYFYFGCATGTAPLVRQEVEIIKQLAEEMGRIAPDLKLVVRPYPFLGAWELYSPLERYKNIYFDNDYRENKHSFALDRKRIYEKFVKIKYAKGFIHLGTTMGFEAAYFNTPVLQINFDVPDKGTLSIHGFIHQYQNDKYLISGDFPNILSNKEQAITVLKGIKENKDQFVLYNKWVAASTAL